MAAFSTTFKLLKTKFFILATHCTNKSKSAEPRAEQQARLIAMPRRESFSAPAKERREIFSAPAKERRFLSIAIQSYRNIECRVYVKWHKWQEVTRSDKKKMISDKKWQKVTRSDKLSDKKWQKKETEEIRL